MINQSLLCTLVPEAKFPLPFHTSPVFSRVMNGWRRNVPFLFSSFFPAKRFDTIFPYSRTIVNSLRRIFKCFLTTRLDIPIITITRLYRLNYRVSLQKFFARRNERYSLAKGMSVDLIIRFEFYK